MSDLDEKPERIIFGDKPRNFLSSEVLAEPGLIKEVFIDGRWVEVPTASLTKEGWIEVSTDKGVRHNGIPLMTGQEWYDRFDKELEGKIKTGAAEDVAAVVRAVNACHEAAKKASGLS